MVIDQIKMNRKENDDLRQFSRQGLISDLILDLKFLAARVKKGFWSPCWKSACEVLNLVLLVENVRFKEIRFIILLLSANLKMAEAGH